MTLDDILKTARRRRLDAMQMGNEALAGDWSMAIKHLEQLAGPPDGYALVTAEGAFVGIWVRADNAEKVKNRSPLASAERVRPMVFVDVA
jgi:hypothetical protein